jgi:hypothetical protein
LWKILLRIKVVPAIEGDMFPENPDDSKKDTPPTDQKTVPAARGVERRGSERLLMDVPLLVRGKSSSDTPFQEETFTVSVSAHGALVMLATKVELGQALSLLNLQIHTETKGRVAWFGSSYGGLAQVGIEFAEPAPDFWHLESPPRSWKSARA